MSDAVCIAPEARASKKKRRLCGRPLNDMPRERLLKNGASTLSDTDLIALILGSGLRGFNVFEIAAALRERFGSMRAMLNATEADFEGLRASSAEKSRSCSPFSKWRAGRSARKWRNAR